jgi:hypothetical protein
MDLEQVLVDGMRKALAGELVRVYRDISGQYGYTTFDLFPGDVLVCVIHPGGRVEGA